MNRNLDGTLLSEDDLRRIALDHGLATPDQLSDWFGHGTALGMSKVSTITAKARQAMFMRGELRLDSRTPANSPGFKEPT